MPVHDADVQDIELVIDALRNGCQVDPFSVLGPHRLAGRWVIRAFLPGALSVEAMLAGGKSQALTLLRDGFFQGDFDQDDLPDPPAYHLRIAWPDRVQEVEDPYAFGLLLGDADLRLIAEGAHLEIDACLGAHCVNIQGARGVRFAVWAPNARRVSVVGDFNSWDGRRHVMRFRHAAGVWEIFIPGLAAGEAYKFEIVGADGDLLAHKADPYARAAERAPATASIVTDGLPFIWHDQEWMAERGRSQAVNAAISIYEVHASSWLRNEIGEVPSWDELADRLLPYMAEQRFTHLELLPIMEHPFGGSWGYQPLGLFAPSSSYGSPSDFARFIDRCHQAGLGVILDWVPAHFPGDEHGLVRFDGTALYEYQDPREGLHQDWNTLIYNLARPQVSNFVMASGLAWLRRFHIDGLRVDAVASMLYRDYSRKDGQWLPNTYGGRENLEAVAFLRKLNQEVRRQFPDAITIAEESTTWPGVTAPVEQGGLGFHFKWNMGWMNDTLRYMQRDPLFRKHHHQDMTFGMTYAYSERFVLPLSHDEVVHEKRSLLSKMPGDEWQRFANLRAYFAFMWAYPGKKLLFMGGEIAQATEWNHDTQLAWNEAGQAMPGGVQKLVRDLNDVYRSLPALYLHDADPEGFQWLIANDDHNSVFAFMRRDANQRVLVISNMTPVLHTGYVVKVPCAGRWREIINTDASDYGGSGLGNGGEVRTIERGDQIWHVELLLPPLSTLLLAWQD